MPVVRGGLNPFFTVPDLGEDPKFRNLFYVKDAPKWRFYSGCPLTTKSGVNIGALCILDDKPRPDLTVDQKEFATTISHTIMRHLEMRREAAERKKGMRMSRGLNAFVEGRTWLNSEDFFDDDISSSKMYWDKPYGDRRSGRSSRSGHDMNPGETAHIGPSLELSDSTTPSQEANEAENIHTDIDSQQRITFSRAANLLRQSLDLQRGGVVFLDTIIGYIKAERDPAAFTSSTDDSSLEAANETRPFPGLPSIKRYNTSSFETSMLPERNHRKAGVLGKCTEPVGSSSAVLSKLPPFISMSENALAEMIKKYPQGKLWSFDEDGCLSSSGEEQCEETHGKPPGKVAATRTDHKQTELKQLQWCFPGGKFLPISISYSLIFENKFLTYTSSPIIVLPDVGFGLCSLLQWLLRLDYLASTNFLD